jgi:hypothetical protein
MLGQQCRRTSEGRSGGRRPSDDLEIAIFFADRVAVMSSGGECQIGNDAPGKGSDLPDSIGWPMRPH